MSQELTPRQQHDYEFVRDLVANQINDVISRACEVLDNFGLNLCILDIERDVLMEAAIGAVEPNSTEEVFSELTDFIMTFVSGANERFNMNIKVTLGLNESEDSEGDPIE